MMTPAMTPADELCIDTLHLAASEVSLSVSTAHTVLSNMTLAANAKKTRAVPAPEWHQFVFIA